MNKSIPITTITCFLLVVNFTSFLIAQTFPGDVNVDYDLDQFVDTQPGSSWYHSGSILSVSGMITITNNSGSEHRFWTRARWEFGDWILNPSTGGGFHNMPIAPGQSVYKTYHTAETGYEMNYYGLLPDRFVEIETSVNGDGGGGDAGTFFYFPRNGDPNSGSGGTVSGG